MLGLKKRWIVVLVVIVVLTTLFSIKPIRKRLLNHFPMTFLIDVYNNTRPTLNVGNNQTCFEMLQKSEAHFLKLTNKSTRLGCVVDNSVKVSQLSKVNFNTPFMVTCRMALALEQFEREIVQVQALKYFNKKVVNIAHLGTYNCRPMRGYKNLLSEHAFANAIDIASFTLSGGEKIVVKKDWSGNEAKSKFLHSVAKQSCQLFSAVLTPNFDRNHADHFHLDQGLWGKCL